MRYPASRAIQLRPIRYADAAGFRSCDTKRNAKDARAHPGEHCRKRRPQFRSKSAKAVYRSSPAARLATVSRGQAAYAMTGAKGIAAANAKAFKVIELR
jgi:hypothetical protein